MFSGILPVDPASLEGEAERILYRLQRAPALFESVSCLDAGCGIGIVCQALEELGASRVVGIDIGPHTEVAQRLNRGSDTVHVVQGSVLELPFGDESFGVVHSSGVLHHTTNLSQGMDEFVRVLEPGGLLYVAVVGREGGQAIVTGGMRLLAKLVPLAWMRATLSLILPRWMVMGLLDVGYAPIRRTYTEKQMRAEFARLGILDVQRTRSERYDYKSVRSRLWWGVGWIQLSGFLPSDGKRA